MQILSEIAHPMTILFKAFFLFLTQNTYGQWQIIFGIVSVTYLVGCIAFLTMGKGELQVRKNG